MKDVSKLSDKIQLGPWSFNVIDISDMGLYDDYISKTEYPANLWTANFAFVWAQSQSSKRKTLWKIVDDMLVTFSYTRSDELHLLSLPYGKGGPDKVAGVLYKCLNFCYIWNNHDTSTSVLRTATDMQLEFLRKSKDFDKYFKAALLTGREKHFSISKLLTLSGKEFETIRRKINKFKKACPNVIVRAYKSEDYESIIKLGEYWSMTSGQKYSHVFDGVYFPEIIKHCKELNHMVLVVENEGKILGMVSGGLLPNGQSWWCISKFISDFDGLSDFLIVELAKAINKANPGVELMNAGDDLGPGGLRFFKERFRPVLDLRKFVVLLRKP